MRADRAAIESTVHKNTFDDMYMYHNSNFKGQQF